MIRASPPVAAGSVFALPSERVQRQIDRLLDQAEAAVEANDWQTARQRAQAALDLDPDNHDAPAIIAGADRVASRAGESAQPDNPAEPRSAAPEQPTSFSALSLPDRPIVSGNEKQDDVAERARYGSNQFRLRQWRWSVTFCVLPSSSW
jgi:hypothetical protein